MKAEINNENKAKFFGCYLGQKVYNNSILDGRSIDWIKGGYYDSSFLELKTLSSISDEDTKRLYPWQVDYLRSKGYLLPWMGLSPDEIIEAGWVKYKE